MQLKQLNARLPEEEIVRIKQDILEVRAKKEAYVLEAMKHFRRSLSVEQRRQRFVRTPKLTGRPVGI